MPFINVYLNFSGNCEEAFNHYKSVFGGEFLIFSRFSEMPAPEKPLPPEAANLVMHVSLQIGEHCTLMGSDMPPDFDLKVGNNVSVSINADSKEEAERLFNGLSAGGTVTMPLNDTFWGAYFGMFTDKFGVNWMVNYDYPKS